MQMSSVIRKTLIPFVTLLSYSGCANKGSLESQVSQESKTESVSAQVSQDERRQPFPFFNFPPFYTLEDRGIQPQKFVLVDEDKNAPGDLHIFDDQIFCRKQGNNQAKIAVVNSPRILFHSIRRVFPPEFFLGLPFPVDDLSEVFNVAPNLQELGMLSTLKREFPEAKTDALVATKHLIDKNEVSIDAILSYKKQFPGLTLTDTVKIIRASILTDEFKLFRDVSSSNLTDTEIAKLLILGFSPYESKQLVQKKSDYMASAPDSKYFSWLKILSYDPDIKTDKTAVVSTINKLDFLPENATKFVSDSKEKLSLPLQVYQIIGQYRDIEYEQCSNYNLKDFEEYINKILLPSQNISIDDVRKMEPWTVLSLAGVLTMSQFDHLNIDEPPYYSTYFYDNVLTLARDKKTGECERYEEVFFRLMYYFKSINPKLQNFYFVKGYNAGGIMPGHTWPAILILNGSPKSNLRQITVTHIDPDLTDSSGEEITCREGKHFKMENARRILINDFNK